ncbi:MAG TPA: putative peptidoglycan glycosyltransferase FtsW [Candidatus Saccharimonadales bacterium]|nr:putative peptidoglycan glycosyltransferase FtsW [Candidatus Saccharimonadales bacterium]
MELGRPSRPLRQADRDHRARTLANPTAAGRRHRPDYWLVILSLLMLSIGLIVVYSIGPALAAAGKVSDNHYITRQLIAVLMSVIVFIVAARVPLSWWRSMAKPLLVIAGIATFIALITPLNPSYPAYRWVRLGSISFQSVELLKFALLIAAAGFLADRARTGELDNYQRTLKPLLIAVLGIGLVVAGPGALHAQSDLGSMGVIVAMLTVMAFVVGVPMKRIVMFGGILAIAASLVILPSDYRRDRIATFMNPEADCQSTGYQACQALIAVGSGGLQGLGLGRSVQAYGYLPEASNDSIFAIYAEKFGFLGSVALLGILAAFFGRMKRIAERAPDTFSRLLVVGVLTWLSVQAMVNIGAMIGLLPLKGITLPFISSGGTSVVFVAAAVGLVFQVSYYTAHRATADAEQGTSGSTNNERNGYDNRRDGRRLRGAYHPNPGSRARA